VESRNQEVFRVHGDVPTTVTIEFNIQPGQSDRDTLLNAKDYLEYYLNSGNHKSWGRKISIKGVMARVRSSKERRGSETKPVVSDVARRE